MSKPSKKFPEPEAALGGAESATICGEGAPPAEFDDKTSLVVTVTLRVGLGVNRPTGSVKTSYGSFGTGDSSFDLAYGGGKWGNFIAANGLNTGRFLDPPEFRGERRRKSFTDRERAGVGSTLIPSLTNTTSAHLMASDFS